jgi:hypothetical protein
MQSDLGAGKKPILTEEIGGAGYAGNAGRQ